MTEACRAVEKNLVDIVEGKVCGDRLQYIEEHLKSCPGCSLLVGKFRHVWQELGRPHRIEPSLSFRSGLEQKIKAYDEKKFCSGPIFVGAQRRFRPAVAVLALLAGVFAGYEMGNVSRAYLEIPAQERAAVSPEGMFTFQYLNSFEDFPKGSIADFYLNQELKERK